MSKHERREVAEHAAEDRGGEAAKPTRRVWQVETPVNTFTGERYGVMFKNGVGRTSDADAAACCAGQGYKVTEQAND